ncbi:hypothetical protein SAMN05444266_110164 [Chitinophaga jiangningensis]|uniref:Uncharacterized protein n=1 Tax=Chitinophaga jiangningensis TaxID=1419482 RepID=A0A1M7L8A9_9BACT|nr:hypothetical protein [Chitinophaga jiangningensis]SHM73626.1 hypothetical protein SAMN05444266_110164 [Chitinophaga jiangningensis]
MLTAVALVSLIAACSKNDGPAAVPVAVSLPSVIYLDGQPLDSISYNDKNSPDKIFMYDDYAKKYASYYQVIYNSNGAYTALKHYDINGTHMTTDSLAFRGDSMFSYRFTPGHEGEASKQAYLIGNGGIIFGGSRDTIASGSIKRLDYFEATYDPQTFNLTKYNSTAYYSSPNTTESEKVSIIYSYDNKPNAMQNLFGGMYYIAALLNTEQIGVPLLSTGFNNINGMNIQSSSYNGTVTVKNTYDAHGQLTAQSMTINNESLAELKFTYIDRK